MRHLVERVKANMLCILNGKPGTKASGHIHQCKKPIIYEMKCRFFEHKLLKDPSLMGKIITETYHCIILDRIMSHIGKKTTTPCNIAILIISFIHSANLHG